MRVTQDAARKKASYPNEVSGSLRYLLCERELEGRVRWLWQEITERQERLPQADSLLVAAIAVDEAGNAGARKVRLIRKIGIGRHETREKLAQIVAFLASPTTTYVVGQALLMEVTW